MSPEDHFYYEGFSGPNSTIVPDDVFDVLAPQLKESELRVLLYIVRRTFGFGKKADAISLRQLTDGITTRDGRILDRGTGMSRKAVIAGVKGLTKKGVITVHRHTSPHGGQAINVYRLRFKHEPPGTEGNPPGYPSTPPPGTESNQGGIQQPRCPVTESYTQDSVQDSEIHNNTVAGGVHQHTYDALYTDLTSLGVRDVVARSLLADFSELRVSKVVEYVLLRMGGGWIPRESPAAWIVAALRDGYELPVESDSSSQDSAPSAECVMHARERSTALVEACLQERRDLMAEHGVEQKMDELWRTVQRRLRETGEWSPVLATALLKLRADGAAELLVPTIARPRIEEQMDAVTAALSRVMGQDVRAIVSELR